MKLVVNPKTRKQEKAVKEFLDGHQIEFTMLKEDQAVYKTTPKKRLTKKEKEILDSLSRSVDFVKKYSKEKEDAAILNAMEKGKKTPLLNPGEKKAFLQKLKASK